MASFYEVWVRDERFVVFSRFVLFKKCVVSSTIKLKNEVNLFIREFLEEFYFPSVFIAGIESVLKSFLRSFTSR